MIEKTAIIPIDVSTKYDVIVGRNIVEDIGERIITLKRNCKVAIITDDIVNELYAHKIGNSLEKSNISYESFIFKPGEKSKSMETLGEILEFLAEKTFSRNDLILALGGGVVGDISGFAAACYLRGVDYYQVPTTFLAAIDSSVGGKTAVDLRAGKNLVGSFKQPIEVLCDVEMFKTLKSETFADGVAEAIKYGVLFDEKLFNRFSNEKVTPESQDIIDIVKKCVEFKREVVREDEFDAGRRQLLNLGHTIGHAIERCSDYEITHGHAVAAGMGIISRAAEKKGLTEETIAESIEAALLKNNLPINSDYSVDDLYEKTTLDKKRSGGSISLIIPKKIGSCVLHKVDVEQVREFIELGKRG